MIDVQCRCGVRFRLEDSWGGQQAACPRCGQVLDIPATGAPRRAMVADADNEMDLVPFVPQAAEEGPQAATNPLPWTGDGQKAPDSRGEPADARLPVPGVKPQAADDSHRRASNTQQVFARQPRNQPVAGEAPEDRAPRATGTGAPRWRADASAPPPVPAAAAPPLPSAPRQPIDLRTAGASAAEATPAAAPNPTPAAAAVPPPVPAAGLRELELAASGMELSSPVVPSQPRSLLDKQRTRRGPSPLLIAVSLGASLIVLAPLVYFLFLRPAGVELSSARDPDARNGASQWGKSGKAAAGGAQTSTSSGDAIPPVVANQVKPPVPVGSQSTGAASDADPAHPDPTTGNHAQATGTSGATRVDTPSSQGSGGLAGGSREYDDIHCQRIQLEHGIRIPAAATIIEINGQRLPLANVAALQTSPQPVLLLPEGEHAVRFRPGDQMVLVKVARPFAATHRAMRQFFRMDETPLVDELFSRSARAMDVHRAPFLLNLSGGVNVLAGQLPAAERKFRRALRVNPTFAPAHLNLACCLHQRGKVPEAIRELRLAEAFNYGNVYGLNAALYELRRDWQAPSDSGPMECDPAAYVSPEPLSEEDRRLVALMEGLARYAVKAEDRGKILNNLAVHFAERRQTELALEHFRAALAEFRVADPAQRYLLARHVLAQMSRVCRQAGFDEADEYERLQQLVRP